MSTLGELKPQGKRLVFDLAAEAGFDTSDWIATSRSKIGYKANPKYCYNWSLLTPGKVVILNLWFDTLYEGSDGVVLCEENYRQDAAELRSQGGKSKWIERGLAFDRQLQEAAREGLPIRVIVNNGIRRARGDASAKPSRVEQRALDTVPWHVRAYNRDTGAFVLARGATGAQLFDQFDQEQTALERREHIATTFERSAAVRRAALARSGGQCELCGVEGFPMESGARYLETHHIVPLCEGGADIVANVIALCPNDHRRAHYAADRGELRIAMKAQIVR